MSVVPSPAMTVTAVVDPEIRRMLLLPALATNTFPSRSTARPIGWLMAVEVGGWVAGLLVRVETVPSDFPDAIIFLVGNVEPAVRCERGSAGKGQGRLRCRASVTREPLQAPAGHHRQPVGANRPNSAVPGAHHVDVGAIAYDPPRA